MPARIEHLPSERHLVYFLSGAPNIWAFGCVVFEMLTGRQSFAGATLSDTLAAALKDQPDLTRVPPRVRRLLHACLQKDPTQRLQAIGASLLLLDDAPEATSERRVPWATAAAFGSADFPYRSWQQGHQPI